MSARVPRTVSRLATVALAVAVVLATARSVRAATDATDLPAASERHFGFGPTVGLWSGAGAVVGGGGGIVKAWASGGYAPVLVFANLRTADRAMRFNFYNAYQVNGDLAVRLLGRPRVELAILLGYKFNSVLGHGGGAGLSVLYDLTRNLGLLLTAGFAVFPSAKDRLERDHGYPIDRAPALTPALQGGGNIGLVFFP